MASGAEICGEGGPGVGGIGGSPFAGRVGIVCSGLAGGGDEVGGLLRRIEDRVRLGGGELVNSVEGRTVPEQMEDAAAAEPACVIALGGDGTVNAAAQAAMAASAVLLVLPRGTMNRVAKDLRLPTDAEEVLRCAESLEEVRVDAASVNDLVFLHSALLGVVPEMAREREALRKADDPFAKIARAVPLAQAAVGGEKLAIRLEADGKAREILTRCVAVTNNPLGGGGIVSHGRCSLDGGELGVYASLHEDAAGALRLLASLMTGRLEQDPDMATACCGALMIRSAEQALAVSLDGEVFDIEPPLRFIVMPRALRVLAGPGARGDLGS